MLTYVIYQPLQELKVSNNLSCLLMICDNYARKKIFSMILEGIFGGM